MLLIELASEYDDAVRLLRQRIGELEARRRNTQDVHPVICDEAASAITDLLARAEAAERERDAAVEDLRKLVPSWEFDESKED